MPNTLIGSLAAKSSCPRSGGEEKAEEQCRSAQDFERLKTGHGTIMQFERVPMASYKVLVDFGP